MVKVKNGLHTCENNVERVEVNWTLVQGGTFVWLALFDKLKVGIR